MQERQGVSFRRLAWLLALLTALAGAGGYLAYVQLLYYRRSAAEHLPANTLFAARVEVEQVLLFDPVRRHLLPIVEVLPPTPAPRERAEHETRLARLRAAGLNLGLDLREIVVATTAGRGWLIALGGLFPKQGMVAAVERVLHEENAAGWQRRDDRLEFTPSGVVLAQAADGTLLVASESATLAAALPVSTHHRDLGLAREGAGGVALAPAAVAAWGYPGPDGWLDGARRVVVSSRLAPELELEVRIELADAARAQALAAEVRSWTEGSAGSRQSLPAGGADPIGLWARTRSPEAIGKSLKLLSSWRSSELDRRARELAAWVRRQLPAPERAGSYLGKARVARSASDRTSPGGWAHERLHSCPREGQLRRGYPGENLVCTAFLV